MGNIASNDRFYIWDTAERFTILQGGNVGIGTASPAAKLNLVTNTSGTDFALSIGTTAAANNVVVLTNGSVGIGTTAPSVGDWGSVLTVYGSGTNPGVITAARDSNNAGWGTGYQIVLDNSAGTPTGYAYFNGLIV